MLKHIPSKQHIPANFLSRPPSVNQGDNDNQAVTMLPEAWFAATRFPDDTERWCKVMRLYHDHPLAGHLGIANMTHLLSQQYEGPGMKEFAADYV